MSSKLSQIAKQTAALLEAAHENCLLLRDVEVPPAMSNTVDDLPDLAEALTVWWDKLDALEDKLDGNQRRSKFERERYGAELGRDSRPQDAFPSFNTPKEKP